MSGCAISMGASSPPLDRLSNQLDRCSEAHDPTRRPVRLALLVNTGNNARDGDHWIPALLACIEQALQAQSSNQGSGSPTCAVAPAAASSSATYRQPVHPSTANPTSSRPANRASQA